jgi:hypothetical protein
MIDEFAKEYLHDDLRWIREAVLWKLDGLSEYDAAYFENHRAKIEQAAKAADPAST